jgi:CheY-like chemotaxis protein
MAAPPERSHQCSVLVVDDDPELRQLLAVALKSEGYDVACAADGREALTHLRSAPRTCVIVLDLMLPVMEAARFRAVQRRDRSLGWIPVIAISAADDGANTARSLGANAFLRKPLDLELLREAVGRLDCAAGKRNGRRRTEPG